MSKRNKETGEYIGGPLQFFGTQHRFANDYTKKWPLNDMSVVYVKPKDKTNIQDLISTLTTLKDKFESCNFR